MAASAIHSLDGPSLPTVIAGAVVLRLVLFLVPSLQFVPRTLARRPELSTPISSFAAVKEALHLKHLYVASVGSPRRTAPKPYASGTLHLPPILLAMLEQVLPLPSDTQSFDLASALLWTAVDVITGLLLAALYTRKQRYLRRTHLTSAVAAAEQTQLDIAVLSGSALSSPAGVAACYLFNPFALASCLARCTTVFSNAAVVAAVYAAMVASPLLLGITAAGASLVSLYPALLVPALAVLCGTNAMPAVTATRRKSGAQASSSSSPRTWSLPIALLSVVLFLAATAGGLYISFLTAASDWRFLDRAYGTIVTLPDLSPNIGLWWYFFTEIFDHFRDFFLLAFNVHAASYALPLTIKFRQDPLFAVTALTGLTATLKSYPTLGDTALFLSLLSLHREIAPYFRHPLLTALLYTLATLMMPALHYLWLSAGSGNANFFYASTLVWAFASGAAVLDAMWAWGRWRWEADRPRMHVDSVGLCRNVVQT